MNIDKRLVLACALLMIMLSVSAGAAMFKCKGPQGQIEFSDKPCAGGNSSQSVVAIRENTLDTTAERQYYQQQETGNANSKTRNVAIISRSEASLQSSACVQARKDWMNAKQSTNC